MNQHAVYQQLRSHLAHLQLRAAAEALPAELERASSDKLSPTAFLEHLLGMEVQAAQERRLAAILASQFPRDLPPAVRGSCATQLFFAQTDAAQAAEVARAVLGEAHSAQAVLLSREVRGLSLFTALLHRRDTALSRRPWTVVRVLPWFERRGLGTGADGAVARLTPRSFNPGLEG